MTREADLEFGLAVLRLKFVTPEQLERVMAARLGPALRDQLLASGALTEDQAHAADEAARGSGRYRLGPELGHGALGRVVQAFDSSLKRDVAVKLVLENLPAELRERFVREAELSGRLEHPNIVPVYDFGELEGKKLFLCMKRVHGRDMAKLLKDLVKGDAATCEMYSRARLLALFQDICLGVAFAHSKGIIHRDLKPSNVMIGDYGETLIVDWGLAKEKSVVGSRESGETTLTEANTTDATIVYARETGSSSRTMEGEIVGTPDYMPPEQAAGRLADVDERSDIYSLGAILFEILTFQPPIAAKSLKELLGKVRSGVVRKPSSVVAAIPQELDAICLKALALRREDRYQTAKALHDEIQLFLEGVKERERRKQEARERFEAGRRWFARYRELRGEIEAQDKVVKEWAGKIKPHQPPEEKRPLWDAEARLRALREDRIEAFAQASAEFGQALTVDAASAEASDGKCELYLDRFLEAEGKRDREEMLLNRKVLATYDREGKHAARLDAPGKLTLRTFAYGCDCLRPVKHPEWRVEIAEAVSVPWRDGRPRPDLPLTDTDCPVPAVSTFPEGVRWGHTGTCVRREVTGVEVSIANYEERDKRLVLGPERVLGRTPLPDVVVPRGSWLCVLRHPDFAPVRLPVRMDRGGAWTQEVNLYRADEIPEGFCFVPGGPFIFSGTWAGGHEAETKVTEDLFVARFATTCAGYLEFLNDLCAQGQTPEARKRQPREGDRKWWIEEGGRFRLPTPAEDSRMEWDLRWPVLSVNWFDAVAYCAWKSKRDGRVHALLHEEEYEKAVRGVDGRVFSYGNEYDGSYSHTNASIPGKVTPMPVDSFPIDESPYGLRGLSGGIMTWGFSAPPVPLHAWRSLRGGTWNYPFPYARTGERRGDLPTNVTSLHGLRVVVRPRSS
ncbi:MAG: serine/threonine protein kinase [Planctomycetota bacterium]|nr:MAG: serine/threonine protein kinase [Planctomycetota bacterium]